MARDFLFELGVEELPPKSLTPLSVSLAQGVVTGIRDTGMSFARVEEFATPRRLAVLVHALDDAAPDRSIERRGPPVSQAFEPNGMPKRAALAFAQSCGVAVEQLTRAKTDKGEWIAYTGIERGAAAPALLPGIVTRALEALPIPKRMRWGSGDVEFVRPVHWVVMLWGNDIIEAQILGVASGRTTRGHRFHSPQPHRLEAPGSYEETLLGLRVIASGARRRQAIRHGVERAASQLSSADAPLRALIDRVLLDEVAALVEWPVPIAGRFDPKFLRLPREVVISTVQHHQRYFPIESTDGALTEHFVTIANIESRDPAKVREGNERVVRPRLEDASFFWSQDRKHTLAQRAAQLGAVTFQTRLGSYADKTARIKILAERLGSALGDVRFIAAASELCKADLLTQMVGEFPELQGTVGRYYAQAENLPPDVCIALEEQYKPRFAADSLPVTATGRALAIADRIDTLAGIFSIDMKPTGAKDPFALRRAALGVLRILQAAALDIDLAELMESACRLQPVQRAGAAREVFEFMLERMRGWYADDANAVTSEMLDAVIAAGARSPIDIDARVRALEEFLRSAQGLDLTAAYKRISNLMKKAPLPESAQIDPTRFTTAAEKTLSAALSEARVAFEAALQARKYGEALGALTPLRTPIDHFFDTVMVMDNDAAVRENRLALLRDVRALFERVADLSRLPG